MNLEPTCPGILFITIFKAADKRLHPCVGQLVRLEMAFRYEMLSALGASEWSLASVRAHMSLQIARLLKLL